MSLIRATLEGRPARVRFERERVSDDAWTEIRLYLSDGSWGTPTSMLVPPDKLIAERRRLIGTLQRHQVNFQPNEDVVALLERGIADQKAFRATMAGEVTGGLSMPAPDAAVQIRRELRPFQLRDLEKLAGLRHGANFSVPGAGKTTVSYALHAMARDAGIATKLLVVGPISAFGAWEEDVRSVLDPPLRVARWRQSSVPNCDVLLVNYQRLASAAPFLVEWMLRHPTHLVVDEAHRAKRGVGGEWGRALQSIAPFAVRRDVLTGTPAPNDARDLAAILNVVWPGGVATDRLPRQALRPNAPNALMTAVQAAIEPLYVRTTKAELELPPVRIVRDVVPMGEVQEQIYSALLNRYAGSLDVDRRDQAWFSQMGQVAIYLLQAASSPRLLIDAIGPAAYRFPPLAIPPGSRLATLIEGYGDTSYRDHEIPAKILRACQIVAKNAHEGRKTLVWSNFPDNLLDLERQLAGLRPALVYGGVPSGDDADDNGRTRERELARFKTEPECMVLLANPAAMAEGVSLHDVCHDAVYIDRTFNAGQYLQSLDRIHRLGLSPDIETTVTVLISANTIDGRVDRRLEDKTRRLAAILADPALVRMALPDDDDAGDLYDADADIDVVLDYLATGRRGE